MHSQRHPFTSSSSCMLCFSQLLQSIMAYNTFFLLFPLIVSLLSGDSSASGFVGINYGRIANDLPSPPKVVELLKTQGLDRVKLYDTDSTVLSAFSGTNISITVALPNEHLSSAAASQSYTDDWVKTNIVPYPQIEAIAVGNEVFVDPNNTTKFLVPAMNNVYNSLVKQKLSDSIKISSPVALSALQNSYPSSAGSFKPDLIEPVIKPMLKLLKQSGSYLMVNVYPFFAYSDNTDVISLDYAVFRDKQGNVDSGNGLKYYSLFDAQVDAVLAAMSAVGFGDVKIVISETGWPSKGDENEAGAGEENAAAYNGNLVRRVLTGGGTPLRPNDSLNVFLFALFNENQKTGPTSEKNYGLFYPTEEKVYDIPLTAAALGGEEEAPANKSKLQVPVAAPAPVSGGGEVSTVSAAAQTWCVANGKAGAEKLQAGIDYACGEGEADCRPIQEGATCYDPDTLEAHASYAFNSYYQKKARASGTCNFGGAAYVVTQPPKFGSCEFPTGY